MSDIMSAISVHRLTNRPLLQRLLLFSLLGAYTILLVRTAWMCDDAFITLRTVDNFVQGYGLVWNVGERVQAYTHPLWMFLLSAFYAFTREPYFTTLAISMALSLATVVLLLWTSRHHLFTLLLIGIISIGSKAFADYSTSGLENPLAHLLLVAFFILCLRQPPLPRYALPLGALAGLIMLNRLDHGVLVMPALLATAVQLPRRAAVALLTAAGAPVAGWLLFSLIYYGFPFPNTFYAKQTTGIPRIEYLERGVGYLVDTAVVDGVTLMGIAFAVGLALWRRRPFALLAAAAGIALYVLYVIWIGGDFMGGRMFSVPLAASLTVLASAQPSGGKRLLAFLAILLALGLVVLNRPYLTSPEPLRGVFIGSQDFWISDNRAFHEKLWLLPTLAGKARPEHIEWAKDGMTWRQRNAFFHVRESLGLFGYYAGQQVYIVDTLALSDAFLARTGPVTIPDNWAAGHIRRPTPDGYLLTKFTGENKLSDPALAELYDQLQLVISGPLFNSQRFNIILNLNTHPLPFARLDFHAFDHFRGFFRHDGLPIPPDKELSVLLGTSISDQRLFVRARGSYRIQFKRQAGQLVIYEALVNAQNPEAESVRWFDVHNFESVHILPIARQQANLVVYLALLSPPSAQEPEAVKSPFVETNLQHFRARGLPRDDTQTSPIWLQQSHRSLPLTLKVQAPVTHVLEVQAWPMCPPNKTQSVNLWLNGRLFATHKWTDCSSKWADQLLIPDTWLLPGWNLLEAEGEHGVVPAQTLPGSQDRHTLFVSFQRLWVRPAE